MLLTNVHCHLDRPEQNAVLVKGDYQYYHYGCDGVNDTGWGCGYRTLQSLCSWVTHQKSSRAVPSIKEIQEALVEMGDKPASFLGSKQWIGSLEVAMCLDYFYDVPGKILHVTDGYSLSNHLEELDWHFQNFGSPIMMGGDDDNSSKGIFGVSRASQALLVLDPHFYGKSVTEEKLIKDEWIKWKSLESFKGKSFYNLCLPQLKSNELL
ncbi:ufm1-specific protease 1 [Octopus sinensis]|uniref:Ufm1-specific protease 1 n=1 Tax=Octopus sinensis TaxID=2607531 RepID=A0A6P7TGD5_9MOLL|nr:ufm1-specific protease 1 [Octopus sinensis]XP_029649290.1 ufm1-specific protease 1 [Octopus sinensis]XP_036367651.1 ufm1-specific protease 1 [Octopus sinensis]